MSKFCSGCGSEIDENAKFCLKCGAQLGESEAKAAPEKKKGKKLMIIIGAILVAIAVFLIYFIFIRSTYTDPLDNFCDAVNEKDGEYIYELMPEEFWEEYTNEKDKDDLINSIEIVMKSSTLEYYEEQLGDNIELSYSVLDETELDEDDIDELADSYDLDIDEAYNICVKLEAKGDDDSEIAYESLVVIKVDGDWYAPTLAISHIY